MSQNSVDSLIAILRDELKAHGTLFRLLESQRAALMEHRAEPILRASEDLESHTRTIREIQSERHRRAQSLTPSGPAEADSILSRIASLDTPERPLLEELVREINRLIEQSKKQLRRNQMLFRRAADIGSGMLRALHPAGRQPETYRRDGLSGPRSGPRQATAYVTKTA